MSLLLKLALSPLLVAQAWHTRRRLPRWVLTRNDVSMVEMEMPLGRGLMARDGLHPGAPLYRYCAARIAHHIAASVWPAIQPQRSR